MGRLMKRYVKEFADDEMKCCTPQRKLKIEHILKIYENGIITELEAAKSICDTYYSNL